MKHRKFKSLLAKAMIPGPRGATGPQGPTGATGATGPQGVPGHSDTPSHEMADQIAFLKIEMAQLKSEIDKFTKPRPKSEVRQFNENQKLQTSERRRSRRVVDGGSV